MLFECLQLFQYDDTWHPFHYECGHSLRQSTDFVYLMYFVTVKFGRITNLRIKEGKAKEDFCHMSINAGNGVNECRSKEVLLYYQCHQKGCNCTCVYMCVNTYFSTGCFLSWTTMHQRSQDVCFDFVFLRCRHYFFSQTNARVQTSIRVNKEIQVFTWPSICIDQYRHSWPKVIRMGIPCEYSSH